MTSLNPFSLTGKTILVTGASSGIGKGIAQQCSRMGATLIVTGRNEERLQKTLTSLIGEENKAIVADLSTNEGIKTLVGQLSKLDGAVFAAGIVEMIPVLFATREKFDKMYNTNLFSPIEILRLIIKKKLFNKGLSVIGIASIAGSCDFCLANGIYGSGKSALMTYFKYAAHELAIKGIRVNTISPGFILTPMQTEGTVEDEKLQKTIDKVPLNRWGTPEDIANGVVYLLSNASSYVTGTDIRIDGGYVLA